MYGSFAIFTTIYGRSHIVVAIATVHPIIFNNLCGPQGMYTGQNTIDMWHKTEK